jgi:aspartate/methionine/tyrosine aminotransferase
MSLTLNNRLQAVGTSRIRAFNTLAKQTPGCISLTIGEPDFDTPACITNELIRSADNNETHYCPNAGSDALRTKAAQFENNRHGTQYTKDNVVITIGASEALFSSFYTILNPEDEVIIPLPAYPAYVNLVYLCGAKPVFLDLSSANFQITEQMLKQAVSPKTKAIILNSPNNPTGTILNKQSIQAIHAILQNHPMYAVIDAVYEQLSFQGSVPSLLAYPDIQDQCILVQSFSKPYAMTGWRMGYVCGAKEFIDAMLKVHIYAISCPPSLFQKACIKALDYDPSSMRDVYEQRSMFLYKALLDMRLPVMEPQGAFYLFPCIKEFGMDDETFCTQMIQKAGVAAVPGSAFGMAGYVRLSSCVKETDLKEAMVRMKQFVETLRENKHA